MTEGFKANIRILEEFITIVMGLGIGMLLAEFISANKLNAGTLLWDIDVGITATVLSSLLMAVRFFHGNMRVLERLQLIDPGTSGLRSIQVMSWIIVVAQGLLISALGLFVREQVNFRWILIGLYLMDVLWLLISEFIAVESDQEVRKVHRTWCAVNGISLVALSVFQIMYVMLAMSGKSSGICFGCVIVLGSLVDYCINRQFYFPSSVLEKSTFVAAPFTNACTNGVFDTQLRQKIELILGTVTNKGHRVYSAHTAEKWGAQLETPPNLARRDLNDLEASTHMVAFLGATNSPGLLMELGAAVAKGKKILLVFDQNIQTESDFLKGIVDLGLIEKCTWTSDADVVSRIERFLGS